MKTILSLESLEKRFALSAYTVEIVDRQDLVSPEIERQFTDAAHFVMRDMAEFMDWKGTLDLRIQVEPPLNNIDGVTPAIMSVTRDRRNATVHEMVTGIDLFPDHPDVGMVVHLGLDGTVKLYGMKAYFDPDPVTYVPVDLPQGHFDVIGVLRHEVAHGIGFQWGTTDFSRHVVKEGEYHYFNGPETVRIYGGPLPMSTFGGTHYGNYKLPDNPVRSGLMYQWGNYGGNRLDWGQVDLAILRDVGLATKNESGLPLFDTMDSRLPRVSTISSGVDENMPAGTLAATVGVEGGSLLDYTFTIADGWDSEHFRIEGNTIVTSGPLDHEEARTRVVYVQMEDPQGVKTRGRVEIEVFDGDDTPSLRVPSSFPMVNGTGPLAGMSFGGDQNLVALVAVFSRNGKLESRVDDPSVMSYTIKNKAGGMTLFMKGTLADLSRNFHKTFYTGNESTISVQMASGNKNLADVHVPLMYMWPRTVPVFMGPIFPTVPTLEAVGPRRMLTREMRFAAYATMITRLQANEILVSEPEQRRALFV
jgi:hypothetical protein